MLRDEVEFDEVVQWISLHKKLKNKAILNLKQYCMCCYVTLSNIF